MSSYYFFLSLQPNCNPSYSFWSRIEQRSQLKKNKLSEFNFVLAAFSSIQNKCHLFHCIQDAFLATQKSISRYLSIATANYVRFLYHWYQKSIPDWSCLMLTKEKKRKTWYQRARSYHILISMINWTAHFQMTAASYLKPICPLFKSWRLNRRKRLIVKHFRR